MTRLRPALRRVTLAAAVPYGFTLAIWGSGAVAVAEMGAPDILDVLLFVGGAIGAFVVIELVAHGGRRVGDPGPPPAQVWTYAHLVSAGGAVGVTAAVVQLPLGAADWVLAGVSGCGVYLLATATALVAAAGR
ncbi:MAG: hypothetical protein AB7V62_14240 [Thermoleophilia bacterium]